MSKIHDLKLNRGEWAELYVVLKLLGDGKIHMADEHLRKKIDSYLQILRIIREEIKSRVINYKVRDDGMVEVRLEKGEKALAEVPMIDFEEKAKELFQHLQQTKGRSIPIPYVVADFCALVAINNPKAPSASLLEGKIVGGKCDIVAEVLNLKDALVSVMGFSIKSKFASAPTLFNASQTSQLIYKLDNCSSEILNEFNEIKRETGEQKGKRDWARCVKYLSERGMTGAKFVGCRNAVFSENLALIRDRMAEVLAEYVREALLVREENKILEIARTLEKKNPLNVPNPYPYYEKSVKDFIEAAFTGVTASRPWNGEPQVNGGLIVVMDEGDVLCYHPYDRETFRDYLFRNTRFEYVSASKFHWSKIEEVNGEFFLPINFSVRFNTKTR